MFTRNHKCSLATRELAGAEFERVTGSTNDRPTKHKNKELIHYSVLNKKCVMVHYSVLNGKYTIPYVVAFL